MRKILLLCGLSIALQAFGNNLKVENVELVEFNSVSNWVKVQFDISWQNSWRINAGPANYDAAWIFIKYRVNSGPWTHGIVSQTNSSAPSGATIDVTADGIGAFLYRDSNGSGNNNWDGVRIRWNVGSITESDQIDIQVQAIEMVYVPQGSFYLGGGSGNESNKFYAGGFSTSSPFQVSSESAITIANSSGNLYYVGDNSSGGDQTGSLSTSWPKGFNAFYCMKYEATEAQWLAFFNSLTETQKNSRDITDATHKNSDSEVNRNTISWTGGSAAATSTAPDRAISFLSPADINAYMDWAGLRPLTELEYEKACRGPITTFANGFAWGNNEIASVAYSLTNSGFSSENISNPAQSTGNAIYSVTNGTISGPLRAGIFASSAINKNRIETGASYYGIMELSGNLYERVITVGTAQGRGFTGLHGNGIVSSTTGNGTVSNWPNNTTGDGYGYRGGSWLNGTDFIRVSDRFDGASIIGSGNNRLGMRCARTAP